MLTFFRLIWKSLKNSNVTLKILIFQGNLQQLGNTLNILIVLSDKFLPGNEFESESEMLFDGGKKKKIRVLI